MERYLNSLDSSQVPIWLRALRKCLGKGGKTQASQSDFLLLVYVGSYSLRLDIDVSRDISAVVFN